MKEVSKPELIRYNRQLIIPEWGAEKQKELKNAIVFIAGAGGLGSSVSIYLAAAGIGTLRICDFDTVSASNLNRQILHNDTKIGKNKAISAKETLSKINPNTDVLPLTEKITQENVSELVGESKIIVDCMDNFQTRFILNKCAVEKKIPFVYGSIYGFEGQLSFIQVPETPCLKCFFKEPPPSETFPVVGVTPGVIGCLEALEVLKYLTGIGKNLKNKLLVWNGLEQDFRKFSLQKDPNCEVCGKKMEIKNGNN